MKVVNLGETNSILNKFVAEIRDKSIQKEMLRFRYNLERIGEVFALEISKTMRYENRDVVTPLGIANIPMMADPIVLATILRAGLPIQKGLLNFFDNAECAFVSAFRKYNKGGGFKIDVGYSTTPPLDGKVLILTDSMLATGASIEKTYYKLLEESKPIATHFVCPISSMYAVDALKKVLVDDDVTLWTAAIDEELTTRSYIVPGLGDAGDLAYGEKI